MKFKRVGFYWFDETGKEVYLNTPPNFRCTIAEKIENLPEPLYPGIKLIGVTTYEECGGGHGEGRYKMPVIKFMKEDTLEEVDMGNKFIDITVIL